MGGAYAQRKRRLGRLRQQRGGKSDGRLPTKGGRFIRRLLRTEIELVTKRGEEKGTRGEKTKEGEGVRATWVLYESSGGGVEGTGGKRKPVGSSQRMLAAKGVQKKRWREEWM